MEKAREGSSKRFLILIISLLVIFIIGMTFSIDEEKINAFFGKFSVFYAALLFILLYTIGTFAIWTLKEPLKIIGAIIFGPYSSTLLIYIAELINGVVFFKLSRILGKSFVERKVGGGFRKFYDKFGNLRLMKIMLLRANPLIPYRIFDVGLGLSTVSFKKFLLAVIVASIPRIFWLQFPLAAIRGFSLDKMVSYFQNNIYITLAMALYVIVVCLAPFFIRENKR